MDVVTGKNISFTIEFLGASGELVIPVTSSFSYKLLKLDGTAITTVAPTLGATDTTYDLLLSSPNTDKFSSEDYDPVKVEWQYETSEGVIYKSKPYRLIISPMYQVVPEDIRQLIGASNMELPEESINLFDSYITVKNLETNIVMDTLLSAGGYQAKLASDLIKYHSAATVAATLQLRLLQSHQEDNIVASRFSTVDLDKLKNYMQDGYNKTILQLNDTLKGDIIGEDLGNFIIFNTTPDVITGV